MQSVECFFILLRQVEKEIIFLFPSYSLYSTDERKRKEGGKEGKKEGRKRFDTVTAQKPSTSNHINMFEDVLKLPTSTIWF